jgi:hypothetical protein
VITMKPGKPTEDDISKAEIIIEDGKIVKANMDTPKRILISRWGADVVLYYR